MFPDKNTFALKKLVNRYRGVRAYTAGEAVNPAAPVELIIEITSFCNLECVMCPRVNMKRNRQGYMEMDLFRSIIDQIKDHIELVYLSGGLGEPLAHPKFGDMVRYCVANGVRVGLSTNASLLRPKKVDELLDAGPDLLLLSLDGATKETHESIRVGSTFETTMGYVEHFLREKERRNLKRPHTVCQMIYMPRNEMEADAFKAKWSKFKAVDDVRLKTFLHLQGAEYVPDKNGSSKAEAELSCILPWRQISIAADGTMALCCRDLDFADPIGNVRDTPIAELWNSEKMINYRTLLSTKRKCDVAMCANCPTVKTSPLTRAGSVMLDDFSIRLALPIVERLASRLGIKALDYD